MAGLTRESVKTYTTFSGVDMFAMLDNMHLATLQGIAISVTREKVPVYRMGSASPVSVSRGKRGIAGSLQFILFDRDAMNEIMINENNYYWAHADEINYFNNTFNPANRWSDALDQLGRDAYDPATGGGNPYFLDDQPAGAAIGELETMAISRKKQAEFMDQIYPFDVNLIGQNEYGNGAAMAVIGLEIVNEGGGVSIDDLTNETNATYIAQHRVNWTPIDEGARSEDGNNLYAVGGIRLDADGRPEFAVEGRDVPTPTP